MGKEKDTKNDTINNVTKLFCCLTYLTLLVSCLPNKKKTLKLFFFQLVLSLSLQNKTSTNFSFFGNKTLPEAVWSSNKWPWNNLDQQGLSDSMTLAGAKEYFKKAESDLECRTVALLNKKQKKSNNSLLSAIRSWNVEWLLLLFFFVSCPAKHLFDIQTLDSAFLKYSFAPPRLMGSDKPC